MFKVKNRWHWILWYNDKGRKCYQNAEKRRKGNLASLNVFKIKFFVEKTYLIFCIAVVAKVALAADDDSRRLMNNCYEFIFCPFTFRVIYIVVAIDVCVFIRGYGKFTQRLMTFNVFVVRNSRLNMPEKCIDVLRLHTNGVRVFLQATNNNSFDAFDDCFLL